MAHKGKKYFVTIELVRKGWSVSGKKYKDGTDPKSENSGVVIGRLNRNEHPRGGNLSRPSIKRNREVDVTHNTRKSDSNEYSYTRLRPDAAR